MHTDHEQTKKYTDEELKDLLAQLRKDVDGGDKLADAMEDLLKSHKEEHGY